MKPKRFWKFAALLLVPLALYFYLAERNSWRPKTIEVFPKTKFEGVEFSPNGQYLLLYNEYGSVSVVDVATRREIFGLVDKFAPLFLSDERICVRERIDGISYEGRPLIYSVPDGKCIVTGPDATNVLSALLDNRTLLLEKGEGGKTIFAWDTMSNSPLHPYYSFPQVKHPAKNSATSLILGARSLIEGDSWQNPHPFEATRNVDCWVLKRKTPVISTKTSYSLMGFDLYSPNGLLVLCNNYQAQLWDYKIGRLLNSFSVGFPEDPYTHSVTDDIDAAALSTDGSILATASGTNSQVVLWNPKTGHMLRQLILPKKEKTNDIAVSPNGATLAHCSSDGSVKLWRIK